MLKRFLLVIFVIGVGFCILAATQPATFHVERSIVVSSFGAVHGNVDDFHRWAAWSPWEKLDPAMNRHFSGPPAGLGAEYGWSGNEKVGEGKMKILEDSPEKIAIQLEFLKPWHSVCRSTFTFHGQEVTWAMDGTNDFVAKAMSLFMNMDKMIGPDFERGLQSLAQVSAAR